jgi:hypothetical protein
MGGLTINISWEYFLGIMGSLIAIAYYTNGRFTALETTVEWLKETVTELMLDSENHRTKLFRTGSPITLTPTGYHVLGRSGLRSYIDAKRQILVAGLNAPMASDSYELQRRAFHLLAELPFEHIVEHHLNNFAYMNGISPELLRRVGAIYLRDIATKTN